MYQTSFLTICAGLYTAAMAYVSPLATIFFVWTHVGLVLGGLASVIGICKSIHEWRLRIQERHEARQEHLARMRLIRGAQPPEDEQ